MITRLLGKRRMVDQKEITKNIIKCSIESSIRSRQDRDNVELIDYLGRHGFMREHCTVRVNLGRLSGHTAAMLDLAEDGDFIFLPGVSLRGYVREELKIRRKKCNVLQGTSVPYHTDRLFRGVDTISVIWVDNASYVNNVYIDSIYSAMGMSFNTATFDPKKTTFALIG